MATATGITVGDTKIATANTMPPSMASQREMCFREVGAGTESLSKPERKRLRVNGSVVTGRWIALANATNPAAINDAASIAWYTASTV